MLTLNGTTAAPAMTNTSMETLKGTAMEAPQSGNSNSHSTSTNNNAGAVNHETLAHADAWVKALHLDRRISCALLAG